MIVSQAVAKAFKTNNSLPSISVASLLSCLHQLKSENVRLEEHVTSLVTRRDHLLAVNARLAIPLNPPVANQGKGFPLLIVWPVTLPI